MRSFLYLQLLLLISIHEQVHSQTTFNLNDSVAVLQINKTKLAIDGDTSLIIRENKEEWLTSYYKNNVLLKISAQDIKGGLFGRQTFYLIAGKLIYYERNYYNMSRMGSCGGIDIKTSYYFLNDKIIRKKMEEWPFECYNDPYLSAEQILTEFKNILRKL